MEDGRGFLILHKHDELNNFHAERPKLYIEMPAVTYKLYPVCTAAHATIDALRSLLKSVVKRKELKKVKIYVNNFVHSCLPFQRPATREETQFSLNFSVAAVILRGTVGINELTSDFIKSDEVNKCYGLIEVFNDKSIGVNSREGAGQEAAKVIIETISGDAYQCIVDDAKGQTLNPLSTGEVDEKYMALVSPIFSEEQAGLTLAALKSLHAEPSMKSFIEIFYFN